MKIKKHKGRYLYTFDSYLYHYYEDINKIYHGIYVSYYYIGYHYHNIEKGFWLKKYIRL